MLVHLDNSNICKVTVGIVIHGCNAQGVMGSGVAKQLRALYPDIFYDYVESLGIYKQLGTPALGQVVFTKVSSQLTIANAITQEFYGRDGKQYVDYGAVYTALTKIADKYTEEAKIHLPYLIGAGLGGGDPEEILDIIDSVFRNRTAYLHHWK